MSQIVTDSLNNYDISPTDRTISPEALSGDLAYACNNSTKCKLDRMRPYRERERERERERQRETERDRDRERERQRERERTSCSFTFLSPMWP